jgi:hypothetical protein
MTAAPPPDSTFYVIGGTLRADAPSYVERQADRDLLVNMVRGEFCYVLTSRQMGKSSLMVRTAIKLREKGVHVAVLDLTAIGQNITPEQWYDGLMVRMGRQLRLEDELDDYWRQQERLGPVQRFFGAIRDLVLPRLKGPLVVFVDEIDVVRSLPFSTDEFFAAIRECYTRRTVDPEFNQLAFCLMGVATPSDLIKNTRMTPFNIARRIELRDFTEAEAQPLAHALGHSPFRARRLLRRVLYWTGGHPYLTQRLCQAVASDKTVRWTKGVDRVCREIFLSHRARERDDNLVFVRDRLLKSEADQVKLLRLYRKVHLTTKITRVFRLGLGLEKLAPVADEETNPLVGVLRLSGITREEAGFLKIRNRIYYLAFDRHWVTTVMPEVELWRLWILFLTGVKRLASFILRVVLILILLALIIVLLVNYRWVFIPGLPSPREGAFRQTLPSIPSNRPKPVIPARSAETPANLIDLSSVYNATLKENWHEGIVGSLARLPSGIHTLHGIRFDVRGIVQLAGRQLMDKGYPSTITNIPVRQKCACIHFLHATGWPEEPGRHVGDYVIHYAGGSKRYIPILYGQDVSDWYDRTTGFNNHMGLVVAWEGQGNESSDSGTRRLFLTSWTNPLPSVEVRSIDYESVLSLAAPFLIAITVDP